MADRRRRITTSASPTPSASDPDDVREDVARHAQPPDAGAAVPASRPAVAPSSGVAASSSRPGGMPGNDPAATGTVITSDVADLDRLRASFPEVGLVRV